MGVTVIPLSLKLNCRDQVLVTARPFCWAGVNFQVCAAARALFAKYWLGPGESIAAPETAPAESTCTLMRK